MINYDGKEEVELIVNALKSHIALYMADFIAIKLKDNTYKIIKSKTISILTIISYEEYKEELLKSDCPLIVSETALEMIKDLRVKQLEELKEPKLSENFMEAYKYLKDNIINNLDKGE